MQLTLWSGMEHLTSYLYFLGIFTPAFRRLLYTTPENKNDKRDIPWYFIQKRCITILYHAIENIVVNSGKNNQYDKRAAHDG